MSFSTILDTYDCASLIGRINAADASSIPALLSGEKVDFNGLTPLFSPAAADHLIPIATKARRLTIKRFGRIINFYEPIYLSNECYNYCIYCGFNGGIDMSRTTLTDAQIEQEYEQIKALGFDSVLLLTGYAPQTATIEYISRAVRTAKKHFTFVGLEIYPMDVDGYAALVDAGADGLTIYQEAYHKPTYKEMHLQGKKKDYQWRLNAPERAAKAGFRKIGMGTLLGLYDWRYEAAMLALHIDYLQKKYWKVEYTIGFPRINPPNTGFNIPYPVADKDLVQLMCALRLFLPDVGFVLSTREAPAFRDKLIELCITQISAGSKTNPGGYTDDTSNEQFSVSDSRDINEMISVVKNKGYDPVLKDWESSFIGVR